jgi:hypothetical protein
MKQVQKEIKTKLTPKAHKRDADGRVIINMTVKDDSNFLSVFSAHETPVISQDVADFLETAARSVRPNESLALYVKSDCIDDTEKQVYAQAIRQYYAEKYVSNKRELKKNNLFALILGIFGVLVLTVALLLDAPVWAEVIDIAAWVFLWEAVDIVFFGMRRIKWDNQRYLSFVSMPIHYENLRGASATVER